MEIEIWKGIPSLIGYYEANNLGRIRSIDTKVFRNKTGHAGKAGFYYKKGKVLSLISNGNGYLYFTISINNKRRNIYVHRAIAEAFHPNPNDYPQVNHIDGNKSNNRADNLEWVTRSGNIKHAYRTGLQPHRDDSPNAIKIININTLQVFGTIKEASEFYNVKYGLLKEALKREGVKNHSVYKQLKYLDEYNKEVALKTSLSRVEVVNYDI